MVGLGELPGHRRCRDTSMTGPGRTRSARSRTPEPRRKRDRSLDHVVADVAARSRIRRVDLSPTWAGLDGGGWSTLIGILGAAVHSVGRGHSATVCPPACSTVSAAASRSTRAGWDSRNIDARPTGSESTRPHSLRQARCLTPWTGPAPLRRPVRRPGLSDRQASQDRQPGGITSERNNAAAGRAPPVRH